jgi:hypothetical protein
MLEDRLLLLLHLRQQERSLLMGLHLYRRLSLMFLGTLRERMPLILLAHLPW